MKSYRSEAYKEYMERMIPLIMVKFPEYQSANEATPEEQEAFVRAFFFGMDNINHEAEQARIRLMIGEQDHRDFTALEE